MTDPNWTELIKYGPSGLAAIGLAAGVGVVTPALLKDKFSVRGYRLTQQFFAVIICLVLASWLLTIFDHYQGRDVRSYVEKIDGYLSEKLSVEADADAQIDQNTRTRLNRQMGEMCDYIAHLYEVQGGNKAVLKCVHKFPAAGS